MFFYEIVRVRMGHLSITDGISDRGRFECIWVNGLQ